MEFTVENLDRMTPAQEAVFLKQFDAELDSDTGVAADRHLSAGRPVYYMAPATPAGHVIKKYPDGRTELIRWTDGVETVVAESRAG